MKMHLKAVTLLVALMLSAGILTPVSAQADCKAAPSPVLSLEYGSRYAKDSASRSKLDPKGNEEADDALRPIDDFLRDLTEASNAVFDDGADQEAVADCVVSQIATWARANAMADLQSETSNLTIGSRIAGFGLALLQVLPHSSRDEDIAEIKAWLARMMDAQILFWEEQAPDGARQGNLRAWAALAGSAAAAINDDPVLRAWASWSVNYVQCKAEPDGSLPQEMRRGKYALSYQLHAIAPLVVATLLLERQGIALKENCDRALSRIVDFALDDLETGKKTREITGKTQSFFDGTDKIEGFHLAWLEAYLILDIARDRNSLQALADSYRPLKYSKLGGNQTQVWQKR